MSAKTTPAAAKRVTLGDFVRARLGDDEARRLLAFVLMWADVRAALGRDPERREVAAWWGVNVGTVHRHIARFRDCFGDLTPGELVTRLDQVDPGWRRQGVISLAGVGSRKLGLRSTMGNPWRTAGLSISPEAG